MLFRLLPHSCESTSALTMQGDFAQIWFCFVHLFSLGGICSWSWLWLGRMINIIIISSTCFLHFHKLHFFLITPLNRLSLTLRQIIRVAYLRDLRNAYHVTGPYNNCGHWWLWRNFSNTDNRQCSLTSCSSIMILSVDLICLFCREYAWLHLHPRRLYGSDVGAFLLQVPSHVPTEPLLERQRQAPHETTRGIPQRYNKTNVFT